MPRADRWVKPFFKQYRGALVLALLLGVATFAFASALMFTSGYLISKAAEAPGNIMAIYIPVVLVRVFGVGKPILHYFERLTSHDWVLRMTSNLRLKLYTALEKDAIFFRKRFRTGDILGLMAEDIGHLQNLYLRTIFPTVIAWVLYIAVVACFGFFTWWFGLVMLLLIGICVLVVPLVSVLVNGARQTRRKTMKNELYNDLTDNVLGVADWVFSQRSTEYLKAYKGSEAALRELDVLMNRFSRRRDLLINIVFGAIIVLILLWAGSYFGGVHAGAANWIAAFALAFFPLIDAFAPLSQAATETNKYLDSIDRLNELPEEQKEVPHNFSELRKLLDIAIENVSFTYPNSSRVIIDSLQLHVAQGEKIAILGRSGSGKSTLLSLMRGNLEPGQGDVKIGGVSAHAFGDEITRYIGFIGQQTYLFNMSLSDNLRLGKESISDEQLWDVLKKVGLKEMVERLPDRLETIVDEAGKRFSGGERHRIALARVLLQDVPIVFLDEPTVGLDPLTEQALLTTLFETMHDKTIIMVTHHLQGVSLVDRVVFIEDGALAMSGAPEELEQTSERYRQLQSFDRGLQL